MKPNLLYSVLYARLKGGHDVNVTVSGVSMEPSLCAGDVVTIRRADFYEVGDILVFRYKNDELLIHRLLLIKNERYYCKGDNAFRLEDVTYEQIAGKVVLKNDEKVIPFAQTEITLSYLVNRAFRKSGYRVDETKKSAIYRFYQQYMRKKEDMMMTYQKNEAMDYIFIDETSMAVFDPESEATYFFDETGVDILTFLNIPCTMKQLVEKLCEIYDVRSEEIHNDVEDFLAECVAHNVVIVK